jgi:hypothetical protein
MITPKQKCYYVFEDNEFDKLVEESLGFKYECVASNEWDNDSSYTSSHVKKTDMLDDLSNVSGEFSYVISRKEKIWKLKI